MNTTTTRCLTFVLMAVLAVTFQPPAANACSMGEDQHPAAGHATMQMSQSAGARADCCDRQASGAPADCALVTVCGTCVAGASMITDSMLTEPVWLHTTAASSCSGVIQPSHSTPPYHPPTS